MSIVESCFEVGLAQSSVGGAPLEVSMGITQRSMSLRL